MLSRSQSMQQPQQAVPPHPKTVKGKISEFVYPSTAQERAIRYTQFRDAAFFTSMTGAMILFEKTLTNWLIKEPSV